MSQQLLSSKEAAEMLGVSVLTLYGWLAQSNVGEFEIRGEMTTIEYFQGGKRGQGRIQIDRAEVQRLQELMKVKPTSSTRMQRPRKQSALPHITVKLGVPDD